MNLYCHLDSPIGTLLLTSDGVSLTGLYMEMRGNQPTATPAAGADWIEAPGREPLATTVRQLREYFAGQRREFDLPLHIQGTPFQRRVWRELTAIPFGETRSYGQLARRLEQPGASRAVGLANGRNPIAIVVPCHRVIGANGALTGFGGGLERKQWLLSHEAGDALF